MKTIIPGLSSSRSALSRLYFVDRWWNSGIAETRNRKLLSTIPEKSDGKEEIDTCSKDKVLVLGGSGFVGSHICKEALKQNIHVSGLSRSGRPSLQDSWVDSVSWHKGDLLSPSSLKHALDEATSVISCVGGFGSNSHMYKVNGTANINAITAASEHGVKRFVYISAADFGLLYYLLKGYYDGKRATEAELTDRFPNGGVILRPGFIHGIRRVGKFKLPLNVIGAPMQLVLQHAKPLTRIPFIGPLLIPPVPVELVAKVAVRAATDPSFSAGMVDVYGILQQRQDKSA